MLGQSDDDHFLRTRVDGIPSASWSYTADYSDAHSVLLAHAGTQRLSFPRFSGRVGYGLLGAP